MFILLRVLCLRTKFLFGRISLSFERSRRVCFAPCSLPFAQRFCSRNNERRGETSRAISSLFDGRARLGIYVHSVKTTISKLFLPKPASELPFRNGGRPGASRKLLNTSEGMMTAELEARRRQLNLADIVNQGSRSTDDFEKLELIGKGAYAEVYRAKDKLTESIVALKEVSIGTKKNRIRKTTKREIELLLSLQHENVITLKEVVASKTNKIEKGPETSAGKATGDNVLKGTVYLVLEYMDHDLADLIKRAGNRFPDSHIKSYMKQLLTGLCHCHNNKVLHRDLKPANLLIDKNGILKLADFGLATRYSEEDLTNDVISRWYRPPELLLGSKRYTEAVDIWSVGCIFAELLDGKPILRGASKSDQMNKILELCGSYDESNWVGVSTLPNYESFKSVNQQMSTLRDRFQSFDADALELVESMLTLDPSQRITAQMALEAEYFKEGPPPCVPNTLPHYEP